MDIILEKENLKKDAVMKSHQQKKRHTALDGLFRYADLLNFDQVHIKFDHKTGLKAIVAVHNLKLGPAIGGCRLVHYPSTDAALEDALRLGVMMSYKSAISNLKHGGAKAVLIKPKMIDDRKAYFEAFADFVNELDGRYITAVDSGTSAEDMDIVETRTPYVTCTTASGVGGDPSLHTAHGVKRGIEAAVRFRLNRDNLEGVHIAIQGAGHVGYFLAKELHELGARLTMSDVNPKSLQRCVEEFGVATCATDAIYDVHADVFAPCALGAILNLHTIKRLRAVIVAGSANNQLAHQHHAALLHERGILYAPDFLINAGGLIYVAAAYDHDNVELARKQVSDIFHSATEVFVQAEKENIAPNEVAERIALQRLSGLK
ncbi:MAG TPA: Glu/Leu/Phe/Val dehydrogenase dimerization domain-containing protein [Gammaproteobacteria bacterium]|nr:Glu/Leu/Phe/Val dehydrogenase dimerization domain-containing protein [Gammaproteobacteria bacterium]